MDNSNTRVTVAIMRIKRAAYREKGMNDLRPLRITSYNVCYTKLLRKLGTYKLKNWILTANLVESQKAGRIQEHPSYNFV